MVKETWERRENWVGMFSLLIPRKAPLSILIKQIKFPPEQQRSSPVQSARQRKRQ